MHETIITNDIIKQAELHGDVQSIVVEVGEVAHITKDELEPILSSLVDWDVTLKEIPAKCTCVCGYSGAPNILERGHDLCVYVCPKCESAPTITEGGDIVLKNVVVKTTKIPIYCFGNPYIDQDAIPHRLVDEISFEGFQLEKCFSPETLFDEKSLNPICILDTARGIKEITIFQDISKLQQTHLVSLHDFDLSFFLQLLEKMDELPSIYIIAIPMDMDYETVKGLLPPVFKSLHKILDALS